MRKQYYALICVAIMLLIFANCGEDPNPCRFSEIQLGMTMEEVREILGPPEEIDTSLGDEIYNLIADQWRIQKREVSPTFIYHCNGTKIIIEFDYGVVSDIDEY